MLEELNKKLEIMMKENPTRTIASLRHDLLVEYKNNNKIKDFHFTKVRTSKSANVIYFGSCAGFDSMYKVILNERI